MLPADLVATLRKIVLHERQRAKRLADALPRERKAKSKVLTRFKLAARATMLCVASSALLAALSPVALANTVLDFDGTNDHLLSIGAGGSLFEIRNRDYTIEWMVRTTVGGNLVTNRYNPGGEGDRYIVGISFDTGLVSSYVNMGGGDAGADAAGLSSTTVVTDGEWHHIAWVRGAVLRATTKPPLEQATTRLPLGCRTFPDFSMDRWMSCESGAMRERLPRLTRLRIRS